MVRKDHPAETWDEKKKAEIEALDAVANVTFDGGENDYIAGQRDVDYVTWRVQLEESVVQEIEFVENGLEEYSDTLMGVLNSLELDLGLSPGDNWTSLDELARGEILVTGLHDNRLGGSDIHR